MRRIDPELIWVGNVQEGERFEPLLDLGVRAIVQLAVEEAPIATPREMVAVRVPLVDGVGNDRDLIELAARVLASLVERKIPTFVCCGAGISRSPVIVAAALAVAGRGGIEACLEHVHQFHATDVLPGFLEDVKRVMGWN